MLVKGGKDIVPNVIKAVEVARKRGILIVWVITLHSFPFFDMLWDVYASMGFTQVCSHQY